MYSLGQTMEKPQGCLKKKFSKEIPRVISLITQGTSHEKCFPDKPKAFPLFIRLWSSKTKDDATNDCLRKIQREASDSP